MEQTQGARTENFPFDNWSVWVLCYPYQCALGFAKQKKLQINMQLISKQLNLVEPGKEMCDLAYWIYFGFRKDQSQNRDWK